MPLRGLAIGLVMLLPTAAGAEEWPQMACAESPLSVVGFPALRCLEGPTELGSRGRTNFKKFGASGTAEGISTNVYVHMAWGGNGYIRVTDVNSEERLRNYNTFTREKGAKWSALRTIAGANVVTFEADGRNCFSFIRTGGAGAGGYLHVTRGYLCEKRGAPLPDERIGELLARIRLNA